MALERLGGVSAKTTAATITAKPAAPTHIVVLTPTSTRARPDDDADDADDHAAAGGGPGSGALHLRGELGVLGIESLLHLLEQLLFVLRERHVTSWWYCRASHRL